MLLKKLMSVFLFAVLSMQSFASEDVKGEKEKKEESSTSSAYSYQIIQNPRNVVTYLQQRSLGIRSILPPLPIQNDYIYRRDKYLRNEINIYLGELSKVLQEELLSNEEKIEKLNQIYLKIKHRLWNLMRLYHYERTVSDQEKLVSLIIIYLEWTYVEAQVRAQIMRQVDVQVREQVDVQVREQVDVQVREQVNFQAGELVRSRFLNQIRSLLPRSRNQFGYQRYLNPRWSKLTERINRQLRTLVSAQQRTQDFPVLYTNFDFTSSLLDGSFNSTLRVAIHYTFMVYQTRSILRLISPDGIDIRYETMEFYSDEFRMMYSQNFRRIQRSARGDNPLINTQLDLLEMHLPTRTEEEMISSFVTGIIIVALAFASASSSGGVFI